MALQRNIRAAEVRDIDQLGTIGPAAYAEAYSTYWERPDALAEHVATFGSQPVAALLDRPDVYMWVAEVNGVVVGFSTLILGSVDPIEARKDGAELSRLYLVGPARNLGLGRKLLDAVMSKARLEGAAYLWLEAMAAAEQALGAYASWGFCEIGRKKLKERVKPELSDMIVMIKNLHSESAQTVAHDRPST